MGGGVVVNDVDEDGDFFLLYDQPMVAFIE